MKPGSCIFCRIIKEEITDQGVLFNGLDLLIKLSIHPQTRGHSLIIPRDHYQRLIEIPESLRSRLFSSAVLTGEAMKQQLGAKAYVIRVNDSLFNLEYNQGHIGHIHLHVIPRYKSREKLPSKPAKKADGYLSRLKSEFSISIKD